MRHSRYRGLSLAEVLATVVIIAIVIPAAMQGISIATGMAGLTRQKAEATALAQAKLNELIATGDWQTNTTSGDFGPQWPAYHWQVNASDWEETNMRQLQMVVSWVHRGTPREVVLTTLAYNGTGVVSQ